MRTALIIFLLFLKTNLFANEIDKLQSPEEINNFLHSKNKDLIEFYVGNLNAIYGDILDIKLADSLGVKPWQKTDFDNNGFTDLFAFGYLNGSLYLIAIIDMGKDLSFYYFNHDNLFYPIVTAINKQTYLIIHEGEDIIGNNNYNNKIVKTDTLIYKFSDFIEPNFNPSSYNIEKIEFYTTMCLGECPVFELEISSNRIAFYNAIQYNDKVGKFKTKIDTLNYNTIITLINYIDFPRLLDNYAIKWTDDQTAVLTITYDNGQIKKITNYGKVGTYGLQLVYSKLFALRENQKWK